jgi:thiol-disulfide isomerase/thioredoxin
VSVISYTDSKTLFGKAALMKRWIMLGISLLFLPLSFFPAWAKEKARVITAGDFFPEFSFPMTLSRADITYLGLPTKFLGMRKGDAFSLKDVGAELIVVEYMNKYCLSCQIQAPILNQVFETVNKDPAFQRKVKFLSIGAGNNQKEVDSFRAEKRVPFPIIPDPKFLAYEAIGDPGGTPFTLFLRKTDTRLAVARAKIGLTKDPEVILKQIRDALGADWATLAKQHKDFSLQEARAKKLVLRYTGEELLKKAQESMRSPKWKVLKVAKVELPDDGPTYVGEIQTGTQKSDLFAKLVSRAPTCDICHATHFFFTFNDRGMIVNFLPLQVTKLDNAKWDAKEIEKMRGLLVGRSILQPTDFDPHVDSISSATMTSALIVDSVNKARSLYEVLKGKGYIK